MSSVVPRPYPNNRNYHSAVGNNNNNNSDKRDQSICYRPRGGRSGTEYYVKPRYLIFHLSRIEQPRQLFVANGCVLQSCSYDRVVTILYWSVILFIIYHDKINDVLSCHLYNNTMIFLPLAVIYLVNRI